MRNIATLVVAVLLSSPVLAVSVTAGGVNIDTSTVKSPLDSLIIDRPNTDRPKLPSFIPKTLPSFSLPPAEKALLPQAHKNTIKIKLKGIKFIGNTVISDEALQKITQPFLGKAARYKKSLCELRVWFNSTLNSNLKP